MGLLKEAKVEVAFLKAGLMGFGGSGKSMTAALLAVAVAKVRGLNRVAFYDTETGSDYLVPFFKANGITLLTHKSRSFSDLLKVAREAESMGIPMIADSVTHVWGELQKSFKRRRNISGKLQFKHWGPIKEEWSEFTDYYINSAVDLILCGRAGFEYDMEEDEEGNKELLKTGIKMKTETDMGYEPSLLMLMERIDRAALERDAKARGWVHRCIVLKDRFDIINGAQFDFERDDQGHYLVNGKQPSEGSPNHVFDALRPHFERLNLGGEHRGVDLSRTSDDRWGDSDRSWAERKRQVEIALEKITETFVLADCNGTGGADRKKKAEALIATFGTSSWTEIQGFALEKLQVGLPALRSALKLDAKPLTMDEIDALKQLVFDGVKGERITGEQGAMLLERAVKGEGDTLRTEVEALRQKLLPEQLRSPDFAKDFGAELPFGDEPAAENGNEPPAESKRGKKRGAPAPV